MFQSPFETPDFDYLSALNEGQREAVEAKDGPILVLAGAGTGKTRVMTTRMAHLSRHHGVRLSRILSVTFTKKAAGEMSERAHGLLGAQAQSASISTFHSLGLRLLRQRPDLAGLRERFELIDDARALTILRTVITAAGPEALAELMAPPADGPGDGDSQPTAGGSGGGAGCGDDGPGGASAPQADAEGDGAVDREVVKAVLKTLRYLKDMGWTPADVVERPASIRKSLPTKGQRLAFDKAAPWAGSYQQALLAANLADFADLLLWPSIGMERDEALRKEWAAQWDYVQVDEYQDTNPLQERLIELLARDHRNVFVVGDDSQAIYSFRGSDSRFILEFASRWQGARVFALTENYRCNPNFLRAANALIANNVKRHQKELIPGLDRDPVAIRIGAAETPVQAARWTMSLVRVAFAEAQGPESVFVTYRAGWMSRMFEEAALEAGLTYTIVGDVGFYGRTEIKDALAYMVLLDDGGDLKTRREAWTRVANVPARGLGEKTMALIEQAAGPDGDPIAAGLGLADAGALRADAVAGLRELAALRDGWQDRTLDGVSLDLRLEEALREAGYLAHWAEHDDPKAADRLENLGELYATARRCAGIDALLETAARAAASERDDAPLVLLTVHASKGLEADWVIVAGMEDGVFPSKHALDDEERAQDALDDERNLAYVALTRARDELILLWSEESGDPGGPSQFLDELAGDGVDIDYFDVPILSGRDQPSTQGQRDMAARICRRLTGLSMPDADILDNRRLLSVWMDRHMPAYSAAEGTGRIAGPSN